MRRLPVRFTDHIVGGEVRIAPGRCSPANICSIQVPGGARLCGEPSSARARIASDAIRDLVDPNPLPCARTRVPTAGIQSDGIGFP
jgi:hypothetical protein